MFNYTGRQNKYRAKHILVLLTQANASTQDYCVNSKYYNIILLAQ